MDGKIDLHLHTYFSDGQHSPEELILKVKEAGIDFILVGDSLGNVIQGNATTLTVTLDEIIYHAKIVKKAVKKVTRKTAAIKKTVKKTVKKAAKKATVK